MAGVRQVIDTCEVPFDHKRKFDVELPVHMMGFEPRRQRIEDIWNRNVIKAINNICRARRAMDVDKTLKRTVFSSGVGNILQDFNRMTENIKVELIAHNLPAQRTLRGSRKKSSKYSLKITRLSDIPESSRNARYYCAAEIPPLPVEARAELVGTADDVTQQLVQVIPEESDSLRVGHANGGGRHVQQGPANPAPATAPVVEDAVAVVTDCLSDSVLSAHSNEFVILPVTGSEAIAVFQEDVTATAVSGTEEIENLPVVQATAHETGTRSVLERMQDLDSIQTYLTEDEYVAKRQAILQSI